MREKPYLEWQNGEQNTNISSNFRLLIMNWGTMSESESDDLNWPKGACAACHQFKTPEGHDPCIANLPGVLFACCGHGNEEGYIKFEDGRSIRFQLNEVDLDLPTVRHKGIPVYQLGGRRIFDFKTKKIKLDRYNTRIIRTKTRQTP